MSTSQEFADAGRGCVRSLDTGRLNAETYRLFDKVEKHYGIRIEYTFPDAQETMDLVREKGMFSFYEDGHQECCRVRKVGPSSPHRNGGLLAHTASSYGLLPNLGITVNPFLCSMMQAVRSS